MKLPLEGRGVGVSWGKSACTLSPLSFPDLDKQVTPYHLVRC